MRRYTLVPFILAATLNMCAFHAVGHGTWGCFSIVPPLLIGVGGMVEGLLAETLFNQWLHFGAVVLFNVGMWPEYALMNAIPGV